LFAARDRADDPRFIQRLERLDVNPQQLGRRQGGDGGAALERHCEQPLRGRAKIVQAGGEVGHLAALAL
jgi:hypothetical protein